jgi:hypothetical protein
MYLGTDVNINENLALHAYLFISLYVKNENTKIVASIPRKRGFHFDPTSS